MAKRTATLQPSGLTVRRDLIIHTYDIFVTAQTRLFILSRSTYDYQDMEIDSRAKVLFLDDILHFSISARRLIELTALKSFSNQNSINLCLFDQREAPPKIWPSGKTIGFLTVVNILIHAKFIELFRNRFDYEPYLRRSRMSDKDSYQFVRLISKISDEDRWVEYAIAPTMMFASDKGRHGMILLRDLVAASAAVTEKIVEVSSDAGIFLEADYRGGN